MQIRWGQTHRHELLLFACCNLDRSIVGIVIWSGTTTLSTGSTSREWRRKISETLCIHIDAKFLGWLCVSGTKSLRKRKVYCFRNFLVSNLTKRVQSAYWLLYPKFLASAVLLMMRMAITELYMKVILIVMQFLETYICIVQNCYTSRKNGVPFFFVPSTKAHIHKMTGWPLWYCCRVDRMMKIWK